MKKIIYDHNPDNVWINVSLKNEHGHHVEFYKLQGNYITHNPSSIPQAISRVKEQLFQKIIKSQTPYYMKNSNLKIRYDLNKYLEFKEV